MTLAAAEARTGRRLEAAGRPVVTRRHRPDYQIALFMGLLMMLGLIVIYAIGPQRANVLNNLMGSSYSETYFFFKQAISIGLALVAFAALAIIPFSFLRRRAGLVLMVGLGACALLALADVAGWGIAQETLGATRWFNLGPLGSLQPAEILKFGVLIFGAVFLGRRVQQGQVNDVHKTLIPLGIIMAAAMFFVIVLQKDLGTGIALVSIMAVMLMIAGIDKKKGFLLLAALLACGVLLIIAAPHRMERVATFFAGDSVTSTDDEGYHITHAKIAIGSGGLFGVGIGNSVQATGYLPEAINDSVFAIMGETFGFVGMIVILLLFSALLFRLLKVMDHLADPGMRLVAAGVFGWLASHTILNIAAMIGVAPLTGITLPLLSFGGTSMLFIAAALGLVFQLSRYTVHEGKLKETGYENPGSRRRIRGSRYSGRRSVTRA